MRVDQKGFTLMELMVAMLLNSIIFGIVLSAALSNRQLYLEDVVRVNIASNLRTSADIASINIKQVGENLSSAFPALILEDGVGSQSDILTIRRGILNEVLTLCSEAAAGSSRIFISQDSLPDTVCKESNVSTLHANFENYRDENPTTARLFIYDAVGKTGEFVDYTSSGNSSDGFYFDTSSISNAYDRITTFIFVIEEFKFAHSSTENSLVMYKDGHSDESQSVAFSITNLSVKLEMEDGTVLDSLSAGDSLNWKDIKLVNLELTGSENKFNKEISYSHNQDVFPRNIMSVSNSTNII